MVFLHKYESICTQRWLLKNWRDLEGVIGITDTTTMLVRYPDSCCFSTIENTGGYGYDDKKLCDHGT
jgi:hypothetical protein